MNQRTEWIQRGTAALLTALGSLACTSPEGAPTPDSSAASEKSAAPWTAEFQGSAILIADEVSIEGPPGLVDHVAYKQVPEQKYAAKTTAEGFFQEVTAGEASTDPIWIHVDHLTINAVRRGSWLERVHDGPVRITARGRAYWKNLDSGQEQRAETIELVGNRPK